MSEASPSTVALVGLGSMGLGMAQTLSGKGFRVRGFDLAASRRSIAEGSGVEVTPILADVFEGAGAVVLSLPTAQDVAAVVHEHAHRFGAGVRTRVVVIDTTTSEPDISRRLAASLAASGHGFLDAPVSGGPAGAASGKLTMMIGGSAADVALARPVIEALATKALHVGPSGAGNVAKLVNNLLVAAHLVATGEALELAAAAGVDAGAVLRVINAASGRSMISEVHFPTWIMSERFDSGFSMALMRKDVRLARELAERVGANLPLSTFVGELWDQSTGRLADSDDFTRMGAFAAPETPTNEASCNE